MWLVLALAASALWGLQYALSGRMLQTLSPSGLMVLLSGFQLAVFGVAVLAGGDLRQFRTESFSANGWLLLAAVATSAGANWCISASIQGRNATVAGLVETSYPIFTAAFAWLLFREVHVNATTVLGGVVTAAGLAIVAYGAR